MSDEPASIEDLFKPTVPRIDVWEFVEKGYLQEVNRRFLHPLGLALEAVIEADGTYHLGGVWDYRDDPEGVIFDGEVCDLRPKSVAIDAEWAARLPARQAALGFMVQPVPDA